MRQHHNSVLLCLLTSPHQIHQSTFVTNCQLRIQKRSTIRGPPSTEEKQIAERYVIRQAQREAYPDEIAFLQKPSREQKPIPKTSPLLKLSAWLNDDVLIRMHGRMGCKEQWPVVKPLRNLRTL